MEEYEGMLQDFDVMQLLIGLHRFSLNQKPYVKKYNKLRKLHSEILDSMMNYMYKDKYKAKAYFTTISRDIYKEVGDIPFDLSSDDEDDETILAELFVYKNHNMLPSITEVYLEKNILRNEEKKKMLISMKNSYVGLFKVIDVDRANGYIFYEDVFTHKKFKVLDISMSATLKIDAEKPVYIYNRIITYEDISFGTGIHCLFNTENKEIDKFIKNHSYYKCSDFSRCLMLYKLYKQDGSSKATYNTRY